VYHNCSGVHHAERQRPIKKLQRRLDGGSVSSVTSSHWLGRHNRAGCRFSQSTLGWFSGRKVALAIQAREPSEKSNIFIISTFRRLLADDGATSQILDDPGKNLAKAGGVFFHQDYQRQVLRGHLIAGC